MLGLLLAHNRIVFQLAYFTLLFSVPPTVLLNIALRDARKGARLRYDMLPIHFIDQQMEDSGVGEGNVRIVLIK